MTTKRHCSMLAFGRGASNQAVAPGITRPLHATGAMCIIHQSISVFLKLFSSIAPFSLSARRFRPPSLIKQTQGSRFKGLYLQKVLSNFRPPLEHFHPSLQRHNSPANSVRELFKSSTDLASLLVSI